MTHLKSASLTLKSSVLLALLMLCQMQLQAQKKELYIDSLVNIDSTTKVISLSLKGRNLTNIISMQGSVVWDTAVLSYNTISYGSSNINIAKGDMNLNQTAKGAVSFAWFDANLEAQSVADGSTFFTITFNVKKFVSGAKTTIALSNSPTTILLGVPGTTDPVVNATDTTYTNGLVSFLPTVLPLQLTQFKGRIISNDCELQWATASELNVAYFEVQKSKSAASAFTTIATVKASGYAAGKSYTYTDARVGNNSVNYYRLKFVDVAGAVSYSNIIASNAVASPRIIVSPNPARNIVKIQSDNLTEVNIFDLQGKLQMNKKLSGADAQTTLNIAGFARGTYLIQTLSKEGKAQVQRFVID